MKCPRTDTWKKLTATTTTSTQIYDHLVSKYSHPLYRSFARTLVHSHTNDVRSVLHLFLFAQTCMFLKYHLSKLKLPTTQSNDTTTFNKKKQQFWIHLFAQLSLFNGYYAALSTRCDDATVYDVHGHMDSVRWPSMPESMTDHQLIDSHE